MVYRKFQDSQGYADKPSLRKKILRWQGQILSCVFKSPFGSFASYYTEPSQPFRYTTINGSPCAWSQRFCPRKSLPSDWCQFRLLVREGKASTLCSKCVNGSSELIKTLQHNPFFNSSATSGTTSERVTMSIIGDFSKALNVTLPYGAACSDTAQMPNTCYQSESILFPYRDAYPINY